MSRSAAKSHFITPIDTSGNAVTAFKQPGVFTLTAGTTYYFVVPCAGSPYASATLTGFSSSLVLTSVTVQDTDHSEATFPNNANAANSTPVPGIIGWCPEGNSSSLVGLTGTGWSATNGVVAVAGTGFGIARFNIEGTGALRTRLEVVVGATGGDLMVSCYEKA